jgi:hypothetical protein
VYVRDMQTASMFPHGGLTFLGQSSPGATAESDARDQVLVRQLHAIALTIYQAQQDILAAQARGDTAYVQARLQDLQRMRTLFERTAAEYRGNEPLVLSGIEQFIASAGTWIDNSIKALPGAIAAVPNAILDALEKFLSRAGQDAFKALLPWLVVGAIVLFALKQAEKTRTYRKVVA